MNIDANSIPPANATPEAERPEPEPQPAIIVLGASGDGMELSLIFQKAVNAPTLKPELEDVMAAIAEKKVTYGLNEVALQALCENPAYSRAFVIARGTEPKTGADGYLKYLVETRRDLRPKLREDGTVDYRDLGFTQNVREGQPLCEIHPAEKGEDGYDIYGNLREGRYGKDPLNPAGKNTRANEEGTMLYAACDGTVEVRHGVIDVVDTLKINGNVDNSTGDIDFVGDVVITGDVVSGFRVSAQGTVSVWGSVESATIQADGDILVNVGINGMNRGSIVAGGNIKCKYIQSCYIKAGGDIYADSIMYCNLECGGSVELNGKRATLIGGRSFIAGKLLAKTIGTGSHVQTYITMAASGVEKQKRLDELNVEVRGIDTETRKLLQIMARFEDLKKQGRVDADQARAILAAKDSYLALVKRREAALKELEQVKHEQMEASRENSYIICKGRVHSGVQITFGPLIMNVQASFVNSRIQIIDEEIVIRVP